MNIPRNEHPKPQFMRESWMNLNGEWEFCFDEKKIGKDKHYENEHFDKKIIVPFCPESELSGIGDTDFHNCVWYRRDIKIPESWKDKRVILHFGAVDYHTFVYINGTLAGEHSGGYSSFSFDITDYLKDKNYISVCAEDDVRSNKQPSGKQSERLNSYGCSYTRTTGIWQTVWMEAVPEVYIKSAKYYTDITNGSVEIHLQKSGYKKGLKCRAIAYFEGTEMGRGETLLDGLEPSIGIKLKEKHLWEIGKGGLYDLVIETLDNEKVIDRIESYFGLRSVDLREKAFCLNGKPVFGRWVLDQGFYPDGIYTAPTDEALKNDVLYGQALGFNGARLHEKIFEERFLYWADKCGYMVWGEHANWGYTPFSMEELNCFLPEWMEAVERDFNHPSIIGWCPFNETWNRGDLPQCKEVLLTVYRVTKAMDKTRPVIDTSGNYHCAETDIWDVHDYESDPEKFRENYEKIDEGIVNDQVARSDKAYMQKYNGGPVFVSEYGGIGWIPETDRASSWGYGNLPETEEEFFARYKGLTDALLDNENVMGLCYTQLYDVEQEKNGLMTYDRKFKFEPEKIKAINSRKAKIEE